MTITDQMPYDLQRRIATADDASGKRSQADVLADLALRQCAVWHTPDGEAYADVPADGHRETHRVRGTDFRLWLQHLYYNVLRKAPNADAMTGALGVIEARARFDGPEREVHVRTAEHEGCIYIDRCDPEWRAVKIGPGGWRIVEAPPVRFRRTKGMRSLPAPVAGGTIDDLRQFINVGSDGDFVLTVAVLLAALRPRGPFPILGLAGEQGCAKSTFSALLRALVDPNAAALRTLPRDDRDLFIAATNGWVLAYDNVSHIPPWLSDGLCRIATGGGFATRALFTDDDEALFSAARPILLNGIEDVISRADLADRAVFLTLAAIPEDRRRPEREIWQEFDAAAPRILGALYDAVSHGLRHLPSTRLAHLTRMADFTLWVAACEGAFWPAGTFAEAYDQNRSDAVGTYLDTDRVAGAVQKLMAGRHEWSGTAADLLAALAGIVGTPTPRGWPGTPRGMSGALRRVAPALRKAGIDVQDARATDRKRTRILHISRQPDRDSESPSAPSAADNFCSDINPLAADGMADGADSMASDRPQTVRTMVRENQTSIQCVTRRADGADDADGRTHPSADLIARKARRVML